MPEQMTAEEIMASEFTQEFLGRFEDDYLAYVHPSIRDAFISDCEEFESALPAHRKEKINA